MRLLTLSVLFGGVILASCAADSYFSVVEGSTESDTDVDALVVLPLLSHADVEKRYRRERRQRQRGLSSLTKDEHVEKKALPSNSSNNGWIPSESDVDPLYQGSGTHYIDLWVGCGDSPQRQTLVVDTGSSITAFPCANECILRPSGGDEEDETNRCDPYQRHADAPYQEDASPCFRYVACQAHHECTTLPSPMATNVCSNDTATTVGGQCRLSSAYLEGSTWSAVEAIDKVYTGGSHEAPMATSSRENTFDLRFGCQTSVTGLFQIYFSDGIMGMDRTKSSYWNQYFDNINKQNHQRHFALCLAKNSNMDRQGSGAGAMILGGTDPRLHATPMAYAQLVNHDQLFVVWLEKIHLRLNGGPSVLVPQHLVDDENDSNNSNVRYQTVGVLPIELNSGNVIIDSGSTATYFSESLAIPFQQAYRALTGTEFDTTERAMTLDELNSMPTILFQLSPAKIHRNSKTASHYKHNAPGVVAGRLDPDNADAILVALPPHRYMRYIEKRQTYAPEIIFTEHAGSNQMLGAYFMDGKMIHFDVDNRRIGFAESTCNYAAPNPKFGSTTYPAFANHPPPLHEEDEAEYREAWFDSLDDPNSESSMKGNNNKHAKTANNSNKKNHHKIRLITMIVLILVVMSLLAACTLRLIRRGRDLRQLQRRQRQGGGGEANSLPQQGRQRQDRNKNDKQEKRRKPNKKKRRGQHEEVATNRFDADGLERMAMMDFQTFGETNDDDDDDDDCNDSRFRDEPSVGGDDIELSAAR